MSRRKLNQDGRSIPKIQPRTAEDFRAVLQYVVNELSRMQELADYLVRISGKPDC